MEQEKKEKQIDTEEKIKAEKALQLGFVDGILFSKKNPFVPEEPEKTDPDTGFHSCYVSSDVRNAVCVTVCALRK